MSEAENTKPGYKHTSLGWIPEDWQIMKFGEIFNFLPTFSFSRDNLTNVKTDAQINYIHYGDIHANFENEILDFAVELNIPFLKDVFSSGEKLEDKNSPLLRDGDLILVDASEDYEGIAECVELKNINGRKVISGLHTIAARDKDKKTAFGFRTYLLRHPKVRRELRRIAAGISVYGISKNNLSKVKLLLPSINEQTTIANLFNLTDECINKTNKLITQKQLCKKWLMQQLLTGKKRLKGFDGEWKERFLDEVLIQTSRPVAKPGSPYLALGIRSHGKGTFLKHDFEPAKIEMDTLFVVKENDLIVNITFAWEGAIAIVGKRDDGALVSHRFPTFVFNSKTSVINFFRHIILQPKFKYLLDLISPGGAGRNRVLSVKDFLKLRITIPSIEEQTAIASVLQSADKEIQLLKNKLEKLKEQKKGLMQVLLTGKKRLKF